MLQLETVVGRKLTAAVFFIAAKLFKKEKMRKSRNHIKPRRKPTKDRKQILMLVSALMLIGLLWALYSYNTHHKNTQVPQADVPISSTGSISINAQPSTGSISIGNETPQTLELFKQINNARRTNGVSPVNENSLLDKSARLKADDMITKNYWSHNAPDGTQWMSFIQQVGYRYSAAAENLTYGGYRYNPEQTIVNNWLNSPEHKQNMLNGRYTEIGIAIVKANSFNGHQNVWVIVTHYGTPSSYGGLVSTGSGSSSSYNPNLSQYLPSGSSSSMPTFNNSSATYYSPPTPSCGANTDSSYYANCMTSYCQSYPYSSYCL